jgi:hypothetical protein
MPWLRARDITSKGNVIRTAGAYHPFNLLYFTEAFGSNDAFEALWDTQGGLPDIPWAQFIGAQFHDAWETILRWPVHQRIMPNKEEDEAATVLADFFEDPRFVLPFRPPTTQEMQADSELGDFYSELDGAKALLTKQTFITLIGNFFRPSALKAALGQNVIGGINDFLAGIHKNTWTPKPLPPARLNKLFADLRRKVTEELKTAAANNEALLLSKQLARIVKTSFPLQIGEYSDSWIHGLAEAGPVPQPSIQAYTPFKERSLPHP